jgi:hypothetical protein
MSPHHDILLTAILAAILLAVCRVIFTRRTAPAEARYWVRTWKPYTPEQLAQAFRNWPDTDERWRALWDLHAYHLEAELSTPPPPGTDTFGAGCWHGRLQAMLFLRSQLLHLRNASEP